MYDYKYAIEERAQDLAFDLYDEDLYNLPDDLQYLLYRMAEGDETEALMARADALRERVE